MLIWAAMLLTVGTLVVFGATCMAIAFTQIIPPEEARAVLVNMFQIFIPCWVVGFVLWAYIIWYSRPKDA